MAEENNTQPAPEQAAENTKQQASAQPAASQPKKKSNTLVYVIIAIVVVVFVLPGLAFMGLGFMAKKGVDNALKNGVKVGNGTVSVDANQGQSWPSNMPSNVPKFDAGKIQSSAKIGDTWTVVISNVQASDVSSYKAKLQSQGWETSSETNLGAIQTSTHKKGDYTMSLIYSTSEKGFTIDVTKEAATTTTTEAPVQ